MCFKLWGIPTSDSSAPAREERERMLQVALGLVGLVYVAMIYPVYTDLAHSKWLLEMKDACEPMFLSWFIARPLSAAGCQKAVVAPLAASVMTIQTVEAWKHGVH